MNRQVDLLKKLLFEDQKVLVATISPDNPPTMSVKPGETVLVETYYRVGVPEGRQFIAPPYPNPLMGPIEVQGAEPSDTIAVKVHNIAPSTGHGFTASSLWWWFGSWKLADRTRDLLDKALSIPTSTSQGYPCVIKEGKVYVGDKFVVPYRPMIGTIGTAPLIESISAYHPGIHGGNMDLPEVTVGNTIFLPVFVKGALLHLGDVHAVQGEGEINGTGVEMCSQVEITIDLVKHKTIAYPHIESPDRLMSVCSTGYGKTLGDAIRIAFTDLVLWMEEDYGFDRWDAYTLCGQVGELRLGNIWTVAAKIPKKYLKKTA